MLIYHVRTPKLFLNDTLLVAAPLYSGHDLGLNNPDLEHEQGIGPIPCGMWKIIRWDNHHGDKGPCVAILEPVGHNACGRSGFLIHGDNKEGNHSASHGCIIDGPEGSGGRYELFKLKETELLVVE